MNHQFDPQQTPTGTYRPGRIRDANLQAIIEAAEHEFVLHGYRGASMQGIADRAGLPKANVHYYFKRKANLYVTVLNRIVALWNTQFDQISEHDDPATALDGFIRQKVMLAHTHPRASKLFATEIVSGAPNMLDYLQGDLRDWVRSRTKVIEAWIAQGKMRAVDPMHLIFLIWSSTQHYADFDVQVLAITGKPRYDKAMLTRTADFLSDLILTGCGLKVQE